MEIYTDEVPLIYTAIPECWNWEKRLGGIDTMRGRLTPQVGVAFSRVSSF
jgi:hypothetical protein